MPDTFSPQMWQAQMMAAQQQQMQLAASQLSQTQQGGQPKHLGYHPSYYMPAMAQAALSPVTPALAPSSGTSQLPQISQPQQVGPVSSSPRNHETASDADASSQTVSVPSVSALSQSNNESESSRSTSATSVETSQLGLGSS
jgi:hypothetical protein